MHLMIIPDGDRRYAKKYNLTLAKAYEKAAETAYNLVKWALVNHGVTEYTFFSLSYANIKGRTQKELEPIFRSQANAFLRASEDPFFKENGIKINAVGLKECLPDYYQDAIKKAETATKNNTKKIFTPLVAYSGELDISTAVKKIVKQGGEISPNSIFENCAISHPVDFLIRTANERRISDGPLLALKYTEFYFMDDLFPELNKASIDKALDEYNQRKRTYGT